MPLKIRQPHGTEKNLFITGTYQGVRVDRSAGTLDRKVAQKVLNKVKSDIESGVLSKQAEDTFAHAVKAYITAGNSRRFLAPINKLLGNKPLSDFADRKKAQMLLDAAATTIYPNATAATRRRQLYTPVKAVCSHVGIDCTARNPKGSAGRRREAWLTPEQAFALLDAADAVEPRLGALCAFLLYTGCRLSAALELVWDRVDLPQGQATVHEGKTNTTRVVHLPPEVVAAIANLDAAGAGRVFSLTKGSRLYKQWSAACERAGIEIDERVAYHVLRHTWATWMHRYADASTDDLIDTGAWADRGMASRYAHTDRAAAARLADKLPVRKRR